MKKLVAVICLVFFVGAFANAQTSNTDTKSKSEKVVKCTEAEKAKCDKDAAKTGAKCETTDAKSASGCTSSAKAGSCCKSGNTSSGSSCCSKGKEGSKAEAAPSETMKKSKTAKSTAQVAPAKK